MATQSAIEYRLSGGADNTAAEASLGGEISKYSLRSQFASGTSGIAGVTYIDAGGNAPGAGTLSYAAAQKSLTWAPYAGEPGSVVVVASGGTFSVQSAHAGYFIVSVVAAQLPSSDVTINPIISAIPSSVLTDPTPGQTDYHCIYIHAAESIFNVIVKLQQPVTGGSLYMGIDPAGIGGTAQTISDASMEPADVIFDVTDMPLGSMSKDSYQAIWIKRVAGGQAVSAVASLIVGFD